MSLGIQQAGKNGGHHKRLSSYKHTLTLNPVSREPLRKEVRAEGRGNDINTKVRFKGGQNNEFIENTEKRKNKEGYAKN